MSDIVERLRSSAPLPLCPFEERSPEYYTTPNDKPCKFCGGLPDGPDKCTGADMRIMLEAADAIDKQRALIETLVKALEESAQRNVYDGDYFHEIGLSDRMRASWNAEKQADAALAAAKKEGF